MKMRYLAIIFTMGILCGNAMAVNESAIPGRTNRPVNDYARVIDRDTRAYLEKRISSIRQTTPDPVEVVVSTFKTLGKWSSGDFAYAYGEKWREIKKGKRDNGVLIILAIQEKRIIIGVGRNLKKILTDEVTDRIISQIISPRMAKGEYAYGIKEGVDAIISVLEKSRIPMGPEVVCIRIFFATAACFVIYRFIRRRKTGS